MTVASNVYEDYDHRKCPVVRQMGDNLLPRLDLIVLMLCVGFIVLLIEPIGQVRPGFG